LAISDYTKAIELNPDHVKAYVNRGVTYGDTGKVSLAIGDLNRAVELERDNVVAYNNLGNVYGNDGDFDAAIGNYSKAIELSPNEPIYYHNRGLAYFSNNKFNQAREDYTKVLKLDPDYAPAYYNRAMAWLCQQEWKKAEANLTLAAEKGIDITAVFGKAYQGVAGFEKKTNFKLPRDIVAMLEQQEEQVSPMEENPFEFQSKKETYSFEGLKAMSPQQPEQTSTPSILISLLQPPSQASPSLFAG